MSMSGYNSSEAEVAVRKIAEYLRGIPALAATCFIGPEGAVVVLDVSSMLKVAEKETNGNMDLLFGEFTYVYLYGAMHEFCHVLRPLDSEEQVDKAAQDLLRKLLRKD